MDVRITWQVGSGSILGTPTTAEAIIVECTDDMMVLEFAHEPGEHYQFERWATSPCAGPITEENKNWWYEINNSDSPVAIERM